MKQTWMWLLVALLWTGLCAGSRAGEANVAVADWLKILSEHQQLNTAMAQLNVDAESRTAVRKKMTDAVDGLKQELERLTTDSKNISLSADERSLAGNRLESVQSELRAAEAALKRYDEESVRQLRQNMQALRDRYLSEVQTAIKTYAAEHHLTLVLDTSSVGKQSGVSGVLFAEPQLDITAAIIERVNKPHPSVPVASTNAPAGPQQ